ncbi:MAG TPA: hypothetical protein DCM28_04960 [Phycisphaerales bacterium]|nr:hypothetical protein [Phycisphaerales bacterium]HCD32920.1 hypothetical protein [Phycisphaerales bacterium]|tara:strand:+ start:723 stop:1133 length:411 start_codon:yes stop_codon:yes gene_type:complete
MHSLRSKHFKPISLIVIGLMAIGVWGWHLMPANPFDEQSYRDIDGIEAQVVATRRLTHGYRLTCRVTNHRNVPAEQVVLLAAVKNKKGQTVVANPLVQLSGLTSETSHLMDVILPGPSSWGPVQGHVQTTVVRWQN